MNSKIILLMILDGWGIGEKNSKNAIYMANTPFLNYLKLKYPSTSLHCSGTYVGLPNGVMGNSEVGHLNIGAGRVISQDLLRINNSIKNKSFFDNNLLNSFYNKIYFNGSSLHLIGLISDGGIHSHIDHLYALLNLAKKKCIKNIFIHAILDGRDTSPHNGIKYINELNNYLKRLDNVFISTICGRYYAMDRDQRWDRIEKVYRLYTEGLGKLEFDPVKAIKKAYNLGKTDEFIEPICIINGNLIRNGIISNGDSLIFFNFRSDRMREITSSFLDNNFLNFNRIVFPKIFKYLTMTPYKKELDFCSIFSSIKMNQVLGKVISDQGLRQLRIAETEKYAHVTYFFNGGFELPFKYEDRCLIPSPRDVDTYDKKPEMSAFLLTKELLKRIEIGKYNFILANFANMDMVAHTGFMNATVKSCEVVDLCIKRIVDKVLRNNGVIIITSDHGNSEKMLDISGNVFTSHTKNKVPFLVIGKEFKNFFLKPGSLKDIAPTILSILNIDIPKIMDGKSLLFL